MNGLVHPALVLLLRQRNAGRLRSIGEQLFAPGKRVRTLLCLLLAVVWLGNAAATVVLREAYTHETFRRSASLALLGYFLWQVIRVAAVRPVAAIEWTPAERQYLVAGPFTRRERLAYRILSTLPGTFFKAACVACFFLPEIRVWWAALGGAFLGFAFLELLRLTVDVVASGVSRTAYRLGRIVALGTVGVVGVIAFARTVAVAGTLDGPIAAWSIVARFADELIAFRTTPVGRVIEAPFVVFANVVAAEQVSIALLGWLCAGIAMWLTTAGLLVRLTDWLGDDERAFLPAEAHVGDRRSRFVEIPRWRGVGPIAWRQFLGARQYAQGVLLALAPPVVLALSPLLLPLDATATFANVVGGAAFYSLVLLPSAMKFDFRMDFERIAVLKSLPLSPRVVVVGQIAVPVAITVLYQLLVIAVACAVRPVPGGLVLTALLCLVPMTIVIYALENTLFLLSPHRLKQDGLEVLFKGLLTFTAKGLAFGVAIAVVLLGVEAASCIAESLTSAGLPTTLPVVLAVLLTTICCLVAFGSLRLLGHTFSRCECVPHEG